MERFLALGALFAALQILLENEILLENASSEAGHVLRPAGKNSAFSYERSKRYERCNC